MRIYRMTIYYTLLLCISIISKGRILNELGGKPRLCLGSMIDNCIYFVICSTLYIDFTKYESIKWIKPE